MTRLTLTVRIVALAGALVVLPSARALEAQELPLRLRDRGTGVRTSLLGTYVRQGELLFYPFFEYYWDADREYKPSELGYGLFRDFRGRYRASEGILFLSYGVGPDVALRYVRHAGPGGGIRARGRGGANPLALSARDREPAGVFHLL